MFQIKSCHDSNIYIYISNHVIRLLSKTLNDDTKSDIKKNKLTCHIFIFLFQIYFIKKKA